MSEIDHRQLSAHTDKSAHGYAYNSRSQAGSANLEIQFMRSKEESRRQLETCYKEIDLLKDELFRKNEQIQNLQDNIILKLREDLNGARRENVKYCQNEERAKKQMQGLRRDNQSMQIELEKVVAERKTYHAKLDELRRYQETTKREILEKEAINKNYAEKTYRLEKEISGLRDQLNDLSDELREKNEVAFENSSEYKSTLQRNFLLQNEARGLKLRNKDNEAVLQNLREQVAGLQRQKYELEDKVCELSNELKNDSDCKHNDTLLQIHSLISQVNNLLDRKASDRQKLGMMAGKFKASMGCLQKVMRK